MRHPVEPLEARLLLSVSMVADVNATPVNTSVPTGLVDVNGTVFFAQDDGVHGTELWKSDGTPGGTTMVKDILPGQKGFVADQYVQCQRLPVLRGERRHDWRHQCGGPTGRRRHRRSWPTSVPGASGVHGIAAVYFPDRLLSPTSAADLHRRPMADASTRDEAKGLELRHFGRNPVELGGSLYLSTAARPAGRLCGGWTARLPQRSRSRGSPDADENFTVLGDRLFFTFSLTELWTSDGTAAGTAKVADIGTGSDAAQASNLPVGPSCSSPATTAPRAWSCGGGDGSPTGRGEGHLRRVAGSRPIADGLERQALFRRADFTYGRNSGPATARPGNELLKDILPAKPSPCAAQSCCHRQATLFRGVGQHGQAGSVDQRRHRRRHQFAQELRWFVNRKPGSVRRIGRHRLLRAATATRRTRIVAHRRLGRRHAQVKDVYPATDGSFAEFLGTLNGKVLLRPRPGPWDRTLVHRRDAGRHGAGEGRQPVGRFGNSCNGRCGQYLYFAATEQTDYGLWRTDGTAAGTIKLRTVGGTITVLGRGDDQIYFSVNNNGLFTSDGTPAGTLPIIGPLVSSPSVRRWTACCTASDMIRLTAAKSGAATAPPPARTPRRTPTRATRVRSPTASPSWATNSTSSRPMAARRQQTLHLHAGRGSVTHSGRESCGE